MAAHDSTSLPEGVYIGNEKLIQFTELAGKKVTELFKREGEGEFLKIAITGGGCNGLTYKMKFISIPKKGDILVNTAGVSVIIDSKSALYIKGTQLDYDTQMMGGGFKFSNPNAKSSCSCGESFSI